MNTERIMNVIKEVQSKQMEKGGYTVVAGIITLPFVIVLALIIMLIIISERLKLTIIAALLRDISMFVGFVMLIISTLSVKDAKKYVDIIVEETY